MQGAAPADRMIRDLVACEHAYINTDHPAFIGGNRAIAQVMERRMAGDSTPAAEEDEEAGVGGGMHKAKSAGVWRGAVVAGDAGLHGVAPQEPWHRRLRVWHGEGLGP